jgi:N-terminal acetyltransferase B complex catalytic subunit
MNVNPVCSWPEYCQVATGPGNATMGYVMGKAEGEGALWHGHVTAVTVCVCVCV